LTPDRPVGEVTREVLEIVRQLCGSIEIDMKPRDVWWSQPLDEDPEYTSYDQDAVAAYFAGVLRLRIPGAR
jgi:hypothetical protein